MDDTGGVHSTMRAVDAHLAEVLSLVSPLAAQTIPLGEALGRTLAEDLQAPIALQPFDNSAMDGYAVRASDVQTAPVTLKVIADIPAGKPTTAAVGPGQAARIMTGAPMPAGADSVVRVEWTDAGASEVVVNQPVEHASSVRFAGEDVSVGDPVLPAGMQVQAAQIGLASALGITSLAVTKIPRIAIFSTGDELVKPGQPLGPGQIYDSNSAMLAAAASEEHCHVIAVDSLTDDVESASQQLRNAAAQADLILTAGGISAGAFEVIKEALSDLPDSQFVSVAMQPGMPQGISIVDGTPLLAFPGNPVSSFVSFLLFGRPVIRTLSGRSSLGPDVTSSHLAVDVPRRRDRCQYVLGAWQQQRTLVAPVGPRGSHRIGLLPQAECLIVIPSGDTPAQAGTKVEALAIHQ